MKTRKCGSSRDKDACTSSACSTTWSDASARPSSSAGARSPWCARTSAREPTSSTEIQLRSARARRVVRAGTLARSAQHVHAPKRRQPRRLLALRHLLLQNRQHRLQVEPIPGRWVQRKQRVVCPMVVVDVADAWSAKHAHRAHACEGAHRSATCAMRSSGCDRHGRIAPSTDAAYGIILSRPSSTNSCSHVMAVSLRPMRA